MNVAEFVEKWRKVELTERSAAQQHFLDLCEVFDHPKPAAVDPTGESFTFEKGASKEAGGEGWADVWKRGFFGWEYKGKHKDLDAAYRQLLQYREALENPPLLVVCDMDRIEVRTNFTGTRTEVHRIPLAQLDSPRSLEVLRALFHAPEKLKPGTTSEAITAEAARSVGELAVTLRERGLDPRAVARFLDRIVFAFFAEDVGLLPQGLVSRLLEKTRTEPNRFGRMVGQLFTAMAAGGDFGIETIRHFNGNLFDSGEILELTREEVESLWRASHLDWGAVDASIFGTLFERGMDPAKRSQLGAHYTSREDIEALVEPVVMAPLRRQWDEARSRAENLLATGKKEPKGREKPPIDRALKKAVGEALALVRRFLEDLAHVKVLDPACGSGNFLYVTLQKLKDLEKEAILYAQARLGTPFIPLVGPWQLYGIEISPYAHELAQMTVWIGYLQWVRNNGFGVTEDPVLRLMGNFQCKDAILDLSDPENPREPEWPKVDFIVGNPPFLGYSRLRSELGHPYVEVLFKHYQPRIPNQCDLCCYWFERARTEMAADRVKRVGLLATQAIRGGKNREVLKSIERSANVFFAESDRPWVLDGANVHVSMIGFDADKESVKTLDGRRVAAIHSNLTAESDSTLARQLRINLGLGFVGGFKFGSFDIDEHTALDLIREPSPGGRPNSDVVRPWLNGKMLLRRTGPGWIIDFGAGTQQHLAARYQAPFELVLRLVKPERDQMRRQGRRERWWLHGEAAPNLRKATQGLARVAVTPRVAKHRLIFWVDPVALCDGQLVAFARSDDYFFGVLHSRLHEVWALAQGTQVRERESGFRYTPTSCFETFPFPHPRPEQEAAIAAAAQELDELRNAWLNPPEWTREEVLEFTGSADGPWARYVHAADTRGIGTVRYPRLISKDDQCAEKLKARTLTNLYNQRPTWLDLVHRRLDEEVSAAYGWPPDLSDDEILARLLTLNLERAERAD